MTKFTVRLDTGSEFCFMAERYTTGTDHDHHRWYSFYTKDGNKFLEIKDGTADISYDQPVTVSRIRKLV